MLFLPLVVSCTTATKSLEVDAQNCERVGVTIGMDDKELQP
jgi:hypothetical protein